MTEAKGKLRNPLTKKPVSKAPQGLELLRLSDLISEDEASADKGRA